MVSSPQAVRMPVIPTRSVTASWPASSLGIPHFNRLPTGQPVFNGSDRRERNVFCLFTTSGSAEKTIACNGYRGGNASHKAPTASSGIAIKGGNKITAGSLGQIVIRDNCLSQTETIVVKQVCKGNRLASGRKFRVLRVAGNINPSANHCTRATELKISRANPVPAITQHYAAARSIEIIPSAPNGNPACLHYARSGIQPIPVTSGI